MKNIHLVIAVAGAVLMFGIGEVRGATFPVYAADAFWQDSGVDVIAGETLNISASGTVFFQISINGSPRGYANPDGAGLYGDGTNWYGDGPQLDSLAILPSTITQSLIGKVGGTTAFGTGIPVPEGGFGKGAGFVGSSYSQQIPTTGRLFFAFNDETNQFWDNSGSFSVTISVVPIPVCAGEIVAWGQNDQGECNVPSPNTDFTAIAAGSEHWLGLKTDGSIVAWGDNTWGECNVPSPNANFIAVAAGNYMSLGLKSDGSIVAWGFHPYGDPRLTVPSPNANFKAIAAGNGNMLGLKTDGSIVAWGDNGWGESDVPSPNTGFTAIAAGGYHSLGLKADGSIVAWGRDVYGECDVPSPNMGFVAIAAGWDHSLGLKADGSIVAWGDNLNYWGNFSGQCNVPSPNTGFAAIAAGWSHSLGLKTDGSIVAWGYNAYGECNVPSPNTGFTAISAGGGYFSLGLKCLSPATTTLFITPATGFTASGCVGGPFTVTNETFSLINTGTNLLNWSLANTSSWLDASPGGGTLAVGGSTNVTVSLNSNAYSLTSGVYTATVWFTNLNDSFVQSRQFTLAVDSPIILSQPQSLTVIEGAPASFSVSVSGMPPLYFQWQKNGTNLSDGGNISGSATTNLLLSSTTTNDAGNYRVNISTGCGSVMTSSVATLMVIGKIQWTQWTNSIPGGHGSAWGTINALGVDVSYYGEVQSLTNNYPSWEPSTTFSGGTVPNPPPSNYNSIQLSGGNQWENTITFSQPVIDPVIAIWSLGSPGFTASFVFQTTNLIAIESGGPSSEYPDSTSITQIGNTIYGADGNGTIQFHGTFTSISWIDPTCDWCFGVAAAFTVGVHGSPPVIWLSPPVITPTNVIFLGSPVTLTENALGPQPLSYQWQTDGGFGGGLTTIPKATNASLTTIPDTVGTNNYDVVVSDSYGSVASAAAGVTVLPASAPIITQDTGTLDNGPVTNIFAFIGGNVNFYANFVGTMPITNQWLFNNGGGFAPIAGAASSLWTLTNVQSSSAVGFYRLGATNAIGSSNSTPAHLTVLADPAAPANDNGAGLSYSYCVYTNHPWAYWRFEETNNTISNFVQAYDYSGHNFDATYGIGGIVAANNANCKDGGENLANGQYGPLPPSANGKYPGFPPTNMCAGLGYNMTNGYLTVPPLNLNLNTVTFTMWIYPNSDVIAANTGLLMNRNGYDGAGVGFGSGIDWGTPGSGRSMAELGYTWSTNSASSYGYHSKLYPLNAIWSFAAWVITPTNTTIYLYYVGSNPVKTNLLKAVQIISNTPESFSGGTTWLGGYPDVGSGTTCGDCRTFDGSIDEVAVFTNSLSETQIQGIFLSALGLTTGVAPSIMTQPPPITLFQGQPLVETVVAGGIPSPTYQWQGGTNSIAGNWNSSTGLVGNILDTTGGPSRGVSGSATTSVTFSNYNSPYNFLRVIAQNASGKVTSTWARVQLIPIPTNGLWTVNFAVTTPYNSSPNILYIGHGVLGNNTYWNGLSGGLFAYTPPSLLDDGVTPSTVNLGATNYGNGSWYGAGNLLLLDQFCYFGTTGTSFVFSNVPMGRYNLAAYLCDGPYSGRGTTITINGVSQSVTNKQDVLFMPGDNTVIYTNIVVTGGTLEMHLQPVAATSSYDPNNEGDFNGAQLQFTGPYITRITQNGTNFTLTWVGGGLIQATNVLGPWVTNTAVSPYTNPATGAMRFFRVLYQ